jgi:hypothetical protein
MPQNRDSVLIPAFTEGYDAHVFDLSHNTELRSLTISFYPDVPLSTTSSILSRVPPSRIESLRIGRMPSQCTFQDIASTLDSPRFHRLRSLEVAMGPQSKYVLQSQNVLETLRNYDERDIRIIVAGDLDVEQMKL